MYKTKSFKKKLLTNAIASTVFAGFGGAAFAQNDQVEEVVVTGIKSALERSVDIKRTSNQLVEAITADDIGKMPDQNVADSLQRIPGVQIDRSGGEGTKVYIRGLGNNLTLLNGDSFISGMENYQSGEGRTEFTDSLEGVPSELLGGVEVIKTPRASDIEGGVGGIINLKTRNALDLSDPIIAGNVLADLGQHSDDVQPGVTLVLGNSWESFGAIFSLTAAKKTVHVDEAQNLNRNSFGWRTTAAGEDYVVPGMQYETDKQFERERVGASLALAWAPTDESAVTLDWFHSDLSIDDRSYSMKYTLNTDGGALIESRPYSIDENGVLTDGSFTTSGENNGYRDLTDIATDNVKLGYKIDVDKWHFDAGLTYASAELEKDAAFADARYQPYGVNRLDSSSPTGWQNSAPNVVAGDTGERFFTFSQGSSGIPDNVLSPAALAAVTNPGNFLYKSHWAYGDRSDTESVALALNATYDLEVADVKRIKFGARHWTKEVDFVEGHYLVDLGEGSAPVGAQGVGTFIPDGHNLGDIDGDGISDNQLWGSYTRYVDANISNPAYGSLTSTGQNVADVLYGIDAGRWDGNSVGVMPWQTYNQMPEYYTSVNDFFPTGGGVSSALFTDPAKMGNPSAWLSEMAAGAPVDFLRDAVQSWNVETETTAVYFETDLEGETVPYTLNLGVRIIKTDTTTSGAQTTPNDLYSGTDAWNGPVLVAGAFSTTKSYTDVLPSLNFSLDMTDDQKLRFAFARVLSRPNEQDLGHGANYNFTRNDARGGYEFVNGTVGNPNLDPFRATQADLAYEWYFDDLSYFSVGGFLKVVDSFLVEVATPTRVADSTTEGSTVGQVNSDENGTGGSVKGFEVAFQKAYENGLGFAVNYTFSDSASNLESFSHASLGLPGVSENTFNVMGFYEMDKIHARIAYTWRDEFLSPDYTLETIAASSTHEVSNFASFYDAYGQLDMSLSYDITDNFSVFAEGINLTSEEQRRYIEYTNFFRSNTAAERRFVAGVKFSF